MIPAINGQRSGHNYDPLRSKRTKVETYFPK